jgi:hypothetical protein
MQTDLYTKAVLTVIALALSAIALQNTLTPAFAQSNGIPIKVIVCDPLHWEQDNGCLRLSFGAIRVPK